MNNYFLLLLFVFTLMLASCVEDTVLIEPTETLEYTIGDSRFCVTQVDSFIEGSYHDPHDYLIDFDNDGIDDLRFRSYVHGSSQVGYLNDAFITCLNSETFIHGDNRSLDYFYSQTLSSTTNSSGIVTVTYFESTGCNQHSAQDSLLGTFDGNIYTLKKPNDIINSSTLDFFNGEIEVTSSPYSFSNYSQTTPDTIYHYLSQFNYGCYEGLETTAPYLYLVIRKTTADGSESLGWVKFERVNGYRFQVHEYAYLDCQ